MKTEREAFEESNNIKPDWSFKFDDELQQYVELDHEMQAQVEEFNEHWDTFRAGWQASAQREGYKLVPVEPSKACLDNLGNVICDNFGTTATEVDRCAEKAYKAMIEA